MKVEIIKITYLGQPTALDPKSYVGVDFRVTLDKYPGIFFENGTSFEYDNNLSLKEIEGKTAKTAKEMIEKFCKET